MCTHFSLRNLRVGKELIIPNLDKLDAIAELPHEREMMQLDAVALDQEAEVVEEGILTLIWNGFAFSSGRMEDIMDIMARIQEKARRGQFQTSSPSQLDNVVHISGVPTSEDDEARVAAAREAVPELLPADSVIQQVKIRTHRQKHGIAQTYAKKFFCRSPA